MVLFCFLKRGKAGAVSYPLMSLSILISLGGIALLSTAQKYEKRKQRYSGLNLKQVKTADRISNIRLVVFVAGIIGLIFLYITKNYYLFSALFLVSLILFIYLIYIHDRVIKKIKYSSILTEINEVSKQRVQGQWSSFDDTGDEFSDNNHPYSYDLDIFGKGSVFQWTNTTKTSMGRQKLKKALSGTAESPERIKRLQDAITELSGKLKMRQRLIAEGLIVQSVQKTEPFLEWIDERTPFYLKKEVKVLLKALPLLTITSCYFGFMSHDIPGVIPVFLLAGQYILLRIGKKRRVRLFQMAEQYKDDIRIFDRMLRLLEKHKFSSEYLSGLKAKLYNQDDHSASRQIHQLFKIVDSISNRHASFYFLINLAILWDYQSLTALEAWKVRSGVYMKDWIDTLGEFEMLSSLAVLKHDHPDWVMPEVGAGVPEICVVNMGHPLIEQHRVCNDLAIKQSSMVLLITGSNMSGKSTLLRTVGINLVLAYAGAPVCASKFSCNMMEIYTCMRVSDNLGKSISSFYAELLRIKEIVTAVKEGKQLIFLLDEIFKGTNSLDRHTGAMHLIKKLIQSTCIGMVSTHDLELESLESETAGKVKNFHFTEYYENDEIHFDYKLKPGICPTRNARYLMKLAGIEFDEV